MWQWEQIQVAAIGSTTAMYSSLLLLIKLEIVHETWIFFACSKKEISNTIDVAGTIEQVYEAEYFLEL